jgi:K+-sensing histidine kinase KdpD
MPSMTPAGSPEQNPARLAGMLLVTPVHRSAPARYLFAIVVVAIAFAMRYFVSEDVIHRLPFTFFIPATLLAAWYGGYWPGFIAFLGGLMLGDYFFLEPHYALGPLSSAGRLSVGVYTITCITGIGLLELLHVTNQRFEQRCGVAPDAHAVLATEPQTSLYLERALALIERFALTVPGKRSMTTRYVVAVAAVTIGFVLRYLESDEIIHRLSFVFFVPATFFAAWYGGLGPGLVALVGGLLIANFFFLPPHSGPILTRTGPVIYALTCLVWIALLELVHATHRRIEQARDRGCQTGDPSPA